MADKREQKDPATPTQRTDSAHGQALLAAQGRILERAVQDLPLVETLEALVTTVEELSSSGVLASILLLSDDGRHLRHGAGPSLPAAYNAAIDGIAVGPNVGSCGSAVHRKAPVFVSDISTDPLWADFRDLALSHGLRACWSIPIFAPQGTVLGTFAMYHREPREPVAEDLELVDFVVRSAALVIERKTAEARLRESEARLAFLDRLGAATAPLADADAVLSATTRLLGEHLNLSVCAYADMDDDEDGFTIRGDWAAPGSRSIVGHYSLADFGKLAVKNLSAGLPLVVNDNLRELAPEEAATFQNIGIAATICMPLVKEGRLAALMAIHDRVPRVWTAEELNLLREVTARSWAHVERVASVEALAETEERLRLAVDNAEVGFWDVDVVNDVLIWPARTKAMFGISANVPVTMQDFYRGLHPDDAPATAEAYRAAADPDQRALYDVEYRTIGKEDGVVRWVAAKGRGVFGADGRCLRVVGTAIDVTQRKRIEAQLREFAETLERRVAETSADLDRVWRNASDIFVVIDDHGVFKRVNPAATKLLGWTEEELLGRAVFDFIHPDDVASSVEALEHARGDVLPTFENRYQTRDGGLRTIAWVAAPEGSLIYAYGRDVTEERARQAELEAAQEALRQSQKLEAVGQLTGGVAHDFNNLLTIIKSSTDLLRRPDLPEERRRRYVSAISDTVDRASKLTGQLLAFARRQALKPEVFDAAERLQGLRDMIRTLAGSRIQIVSEIADEACLVEADLSQFETALLNMAVNARDAMNGEGRLTLRVEGVQDMPAIRGHGGGSGLFVAVSVGDTGVGIPTEKLTQIFEPFFTTKEVGKGTGLGLSQVYGFAKQSGGDVTVTSEVGRGTVFTLYLPRTGKSATEDAALDGREGAGPAEGRGRRVLVVEDNVEVGQFSTQILQDLGYETTWAANAEEALNLLTTVDSFDVVFSDVVMPGMSGVELGREIRRIKPRLPVVLTSGYSHVLAEEGRHGFELLQKPYAAEELSRALRRVTRQRGSISPKV